MNAPLSRSIRETIAYFDVVSYPLTLIEVYEWLWKPDGVYSFKEVTKEVESLVASGILEQKQAFYFLKGREELVQSRLDAYLLVQEKMRIAKKAIWFLRFVPHISSVFVCNTVAGGVPSKESDIDVFIVIDEGHIWFTRLLVTVLLSITRYRRTGKKIHNRICLSFYATKDHLALRHIQILSQDIYLTYWISQLVPVFDPNSDAQKIIQENGWVYRRLPHMMKESLPHPNWVVKDGRASFTIRIFLEKFLQIFGGMEEYLARWMQKKKMDKNVHSLQLLPDSRVIVSDTMLKFHENDRRAYYANEWKKRCV